MPEPRRELEAAPGALLPAPSTTPQRPSPATSKERNQRKLTAARDLLSRHSVQRGTPIAAIESRPAEESWFPAQPLDATGSFTTGALTARPGMPTAATTDPLGPSPLTGTGSFAALGVADTGSSAAPLGPSPFTDTGSFTAVGVTDTGSFVPAFPAPQTGMPAGPADPYTTGTYNTDPLMAQPGMTAATTDPLGPSPLTDTAAFAAPAAAGGAPEAAYAGKAMKALAFARAQIGRPCVWGATGPDSYDCSSLTQAAWKAAGVALPRTAAEQAGAGTPVTPADIQVGDLIVFFDNAGHVGFCTGNGMMIHAPGPGAFIREESIYGAGESAIHRVVRPV
ncbi:C40 family peptidase [Streptomyces sp. NPDC058964]|uniref:C40 family peptidase n=1 Tax=Streptomyces sp. NPDC058964 TaxID=3346681 RepID=UPI0036C338D2